MVVLVVEDETLVRLFASDFLDEAGFKVFEAVNADEALRVLQARPDVQVVLTDIEMPGSMDGLELTKVIRQRWPGVGIVVTSGRAVPGRDGLPDGTAFITKPFLPGTVVQVICQMAQPQVIDPAAVAVA
jgi:CheY-like chemotaxis protein